jgi:hypothetical protein
MALDLYCNTIDGDLGEILTTLREFDLDTIPSPVQREGLDALMALLAWAQSFTGTLRYDVLADHTDCPEHDDALRAKLARCKTAIAAL